jgi:hypothetical protein
MVGDKGMVEKARGIVFDNESGMYWAKYMGEWYLVHDLEQKEATSSGIALKDWEFYSAENKKIIAGRKENSRKEGEGRGAATPPKEPSTTPPQRTLPEAIEKEREREDMIEASDIHLNSDLVLQYEAEFTNRKTGEKTSRKWLGVNAWKLGLIEGYIKTGYSCDIQYTTEGDVVKCTVKLKKGDQEVSSEGVYTKNRLRSFLSSSKDECFETFAFRNAIKKIVSLKDVVTAVKTVQAEMQAMGVLPTKQVKELGE